MTTYTTNDDITITFTDQNCSLLEIDEKVNLTMPIKK